MSTAYYIGLFVVICIVVFALLIFAPSQNILLKLETQCPAMYWAIHTNYKKIVEEIIASTGASRDDMDVQANGCNLDAILMDQPYIRGNVEIIPIYYNNKYSNHVHFPTLLSTLHSICGHVNITNVFFWRIYTNSAIGEHTDHPDESSTCSGKALRYTVAINSMALTEEECSLWVDGKIKKMDLDDSALWDPSNNYSLHNNTYSDNPILFLNIDFECK